jgi:hypothetical protein
VADEHCAASLERRADGKLSRSVHPARCPLIDSLARARHTSGMLTPKEAYHQAAPGTRVIGWKLAPAEREALLARFRPRYAKTVADHVTLRAHVDEGAALPPPCVAAIVGRSDDGRGVEAMVVQLDGGTGRPDGSTYHITWSLGKGRKAVESNDVIAQSGWKPVEPPQPVTLHPACF